MNDVPSILIVDSNAGFAAMLQQSLEQDGAYRATATYDGEEALQALSADVFDLAIVDLGVDAVGDLDGPTVARALRARQRDLRLMLIPLTGDEPPPELADLDVQGTLPKPFFLPDLPGRIDDALTRPIIEVEAEAEEPEAPVEAEEPEPPIEVEEEEPEAVVEPHRDEAREPKVLDASVPELTRELARLSQEINAEAVLLTRGEETIASAGRLSAEELDELARTVAESWRISARVAQVLGREQRHFEQSVEGDRHMLYSLTVDGDVILSTALRVHTALGIVRHRAKQTARLLRELLNVPR